MGEPGQNHWTTVAQFLVWDDGTDTRYELVDGRVVAMAPPATFHGTIVMNVGTAINRRLESRPPCRSQGEAGVHLDDYTFYVADLAATCSPSKNTAAVVDPFLLVEVLSPSTKAFDLEVKVHRYARLASVQEIWLVDSERRWVQLWVRSGDAWLVRMMEAAETFDSPALGDRITLDEIYRNVELESGDRTTQEATS